MIYTYTNVRFRAGPLPEEFMAALAEHGHTKVSKYATCFQRAFCASARQRLRLSAWIENHGYVNRKQEKYE
jgi:hypothetical protein